MGIENYHINIRNIIYNYSLNNKNTLDLENKEIENNGSTASAEIYLNINYKGNNYYYEKYIYSLSAKLFTYYRLYLDYIEFEDDNNIKENKKRVFRNSLSNYELDGKYYLC